MMMWKVALAAMVVSGCLAQTTEPSKFFRLEFTVREMDGTKIVMSRKYVLTLEADTKSPSSGSIRSGSKVPVHTGPADSALVNTQFTFLEVGVNIDCNGARLVDNNNLALHVTSDVSSTAAAPDGNLPPVIRQNKWSSTVVVPLRKTTVLFSSDDLGSTHQTQLEMVATPIG